MDRLRAEVETLQIIDNPAVLKLLDADIEKRFIVTEYHPLGTLDKHLDRYAGKPVEALIALKPIVAALQRIHHNHGAIHRDIKTENIFVASDNRLVLGDFGIVFSPEGIRLTGCHERVGSHYWMAPWAYKKERLDIDQINATLDIFPLGKVLWSMIAGRSGFAFWECERDENNLEKLFPNAPMVSLVNRQIICRCVVREEKDCIQSAPALPGEIDRLIVTRAYLTVQTLFVRIAFYGWQVP